MQMILQKIADTQECLKCQIKVHVLELVNVNKTKVILFGNGGNIKINVLYLMVTR